MPPLNSDFCAELQNGVISLLQQKAIQLLVYEQSEEICAQFAVSSIIIAT
jgi:hypothetical protein